MSEAAERLAEVAARLPLDDVDRLVEAAIAGRAAVIDLRAAVSSPALRHACETVLSSGEALDWAAGCLTGAATAARQAATAQSVDIVWTGPESDVRTGRLTAPVVVELIDEARSELLLASYATRDEPRIEAALLGAAGRGVDITLLLERHVDNRSYDGDDAVLASLACRRWCWPRSSRPYGASLHAKVIVVDSDVALLGSANLTGRAVDANLECGALIRGGPQPRAIRDHLWSLRRRGILEEVS